jgi:hypothetical protein
MAVCEFCKSTILKDAESVKDIGKMSDVLADYSPIQIGTTGRFGGQSFTVVGRIQLRYAAGLWNEWYVVMDDGSAAWLSDFSGHFTFTTKKSSEQALPDFSELAPARRFSINGSVYSVAEVRIAECIAGQGELPFKVGQGWQARVADFRSGLGFMTLDYSEADLPTMYVGHAVTLTALQCQFLRDDDAVKESAGKFKGKTSSLSCPSCGSGVNYVPGLTTHLVCPSCSAQVDTSGAVAQVMAAGERVTAEKTTLALGAHASIRGAQYNIIGLMQRSDDEDTRWTEYLLYSPSAGFLWLVETDEAWMCTKVQDEWPNWSQGDIALLGGKEFSKLYEYLAHVDFAAGAFNWRVCKGDVVKVIEFKSGQNFLSAEMTAEEITWSMSSPVFPDQIRAWFGNHIQADRKVGNETSKNKYSTLAIRFIVGILMFNAAPLLLAFSSTWHIVLLSSVVIYLPAKFFDLLVSRGFEGFEEDEL